MIVLSRRKRLPGSNRRRRSLLLRRCFKWSLIVAAAVVGEVEGEWIGGRIGEGLNEEMAGGVVDAGDERLGGSLEGVAAGEGADGGDGGERGVEVEAVDVDELAELEAVRENEIGVRVREKNVSRIERI